MSDLEYIRSLVNNNGPKPEQYEELNNWFKAVGKKVKEKVITRAQVRDMWSAFGDAFSISTLQGFAAHKPYGYAGDFEIIDKIYTKWLSPRDDLVNWDKFFHWQKATIAVRNRKTYFKQLLSELDIAPRTILNVGSGPCRDISEYLDEYPSTKIRFECLDMDKNAIKYAQRLLDGAEVIFYCQNAFKFSPNKKYDFIWSAGLFDYLNDKQFIFLLRRLLNMLLPNSEAMIGNFSETNPSKDYMEFGEWFLYHRNEEDLCILAEKSGCDPNSISIDREPSGVNLFLRVRKD